MTIHPLGLLPHERVAHKHDWRFQFGTVGATATYDCSERRCSAVRVTQAEGAPPHVVHVWANGEVEVLPS